MSIAFSGCRTRSGGWISAVAKQAKLFNLKPLKKVTVCFDPFHEKVSETRDFLFQLSSPRVAATNIHCSLKTEIVCDRSDPVITCNFESGEKLILKSANLTALDLMKIFNEHVSSKIKPADPESGNSTVKSKAKGKKK